MHNSATEFSIQRVQMHCCACGILHLEATNALFRYGILHLEATKAQFRYGILHSEGTNALLRMRNSPFRGYKCTVAHAEYFITKLSNTFSDRSTCLV
jgi:hypothetical protein